MIELGNMNILFFLMMLKTNVIVIEKSPVVVEMPTTSYSEIDSCHYKGCKMASGKRAYVGAVACPRAWELGQRIMLGGQEYVCEDRYNANLSDRIDVFQGYGKDAHRIARNYGIQNKYILIK